MLDARVRTAWRRAAFFPPDKSIYYPDHPKVQEFTLAKGRRVLDYGCGGGADTLAYLKAGATVWFADVVLENVIATTKRVKGLGFRMPEDTVAVVLEDSVPIPLSDESVDIISSHGVIHHIPEPKPVLAEFHRLLVPGGLLYMMLYTEQLYAIHAEWVEHLIMTKGLPNTEAFAWCTDGEGVPYARYYTETEGLALLDETGFRPRHSYLYNNQQFRTFKAERL